MDSAGFFVAVACAILSALFVVRSTNLIHAVLWLGVTLLTTAGLYAMLGASFLAGVQVLVYVGGVITLMIFGVMITRRHEGLVVQASSAHSGRAAFVALALFGVVAAAILGTPGLDVPMATAARAPVSAADLGRSLLGEHVLAFEVVSFLLLGAIIGAIRRDRAKARSGSGALERDARGGPGFARGDDMTLSHCLLLATALFATGVYGLLSRRQAVAVLLSVELMANAGNLCFVAFSHFRGGELGQIFTIFSVAITVAEVAVGLALVILFYRRFGDTRLELASEMKQ